MFLPSLVFIIFAILYHLQVTKHVPSFTMFDLMMHSTHFIYGYMVLDIWYWTYGKELCRKRKPAATTTWATHFD